MKHFWQFLIIAISWKYVRRQPICFETAPHVGVFHSPAIFAVLHWSFVFKHQTLLCCCLILVTISVGRKSKDRSFWWHSLHEVNTSRRCVLDDHWQRNSNYSCTHIPVDGPPTRVCVSRSLLVLLTYEYLGGYGISIEVTSWSPPSSPNQDPEDHHTVEIFFFLFPSYVSGLHHFGRDFCTCDCLYNPTIEVITFHLHNHYAKGSNTGQACMTNDSLALGLKEWRTVGAIWGLMGEPACLITPMLGLLAGGPETGET